jgi:hypothetical protein
MHSGTLHILFLLIWFSLIQFYFTRFKNYVKVIQCCHNRLIYVQCLFSGSKSYTTFRKFALFPSSEKEENKRLKMPKGKSGPTLNKAARRQYVWWFIASFTL